MNQLEFILRLSLISFTIQGCTAKSNVVGNSQKLNFSREHEDLIQRWENNFETLKDFISRSIKAFMPYILSSATSEELKISSQCSRSLFQYVAALKSTTPWALHMIDASAKMIDGVLTGTVTAFGAYDQCVEVKATENKGMGSRTAKHLFRGQYCTIEGRPALPAKPRFYTLRKRLDAFKAFENRTGMLHELTKHVQLFYFLPFRLGVCVPSTCTAQDIHNIALSVTGKFLDANISTPRCETKQPLVIENFQLPAICVFSILMFLMVLGTLLDVIYINRIECDKKVDCCSKLSVRCLRSFSAYTNLQKLLDVDSASDKLKVLHGIRFYSMCWIVLGHTYFHLDFSMLRSLRITIDLSSQFAFNIVTNASLLVDNFFFISGLLMAYVTLGMVKKTGSQPSIMHFIIHRLWRFWPMQMAFVGVSTVLPWLGSGPLWHENVDPLVEGCRSDWWANALFINNLYRSGTNGCVSHAWYLAADFQIYLICLVVLRALLRRPRLGLWINMSLIVASILATGLQNYIKDLPPTMLFSNPDAEQRIRLMMETYYVPYQHLGPFCIGIFVGYYLYSQPSTVKFHPMVQVVAWILSFTLTSSALFGVHAWNKGLDPGPLLTVLYASLSRVGWTLGLAWITVACSTGHGGILMRLLSWNALVPLSRLTFSVYLIHPFMQRVFYANLREGFQAKNYAAVFLFFGFLVASYGIAVGTTLLLETPFMNLGKIVFESHRGKSNDSSQVKTPPHCDPCCNQDAKMNLCIQDKAGSETMCVKNGINAIKTDSFLIKPDVEASNRISKGDFICHL